MEKSMNMTINRLPAITWNRLKMNEAFVPDVKIPVAGTYEEQLGKHAGINLGSGLELHQADENEKQLFDSGLFVKHKNGTVTAAKPAKADKSPDAKGASSADAS